MIKALEEPPVLQHKYQLHGRQVFLAHNTYCISYQTG